MTVNLICPIHDVASLLPHSGHMVLLDCVTEYRPLYFKISVISTSWISACAGMTAVSMTHYLNNRFYR